MGFLWMTVQYENFGYGRGWIHWLSPCRQIDAEWEEWGMPNFLLCHSLVHESSDITDAAIGSWFSLAPKKLRHTEFYSINICVWLYHQKENFDQCVCLSCYNVSLGAYIWHAFFLLRWLLLITTSLDLKITWGNGLVIQDLSLFVMVLFSFALSLQGGHNQDC